MRASRASHLAAAIVRVGIVNGPVLAEDIRRAWRRVVDREPLWGPLDHALYELHRLHVRAGNIGRLDDWLTADGRRPKVFKVDRNAR